MAGSFLWDSWFSWSGLRFRAVFVGTLLTVGLLVFFGGTLLLDAWWDRWRERCGLGDGLEPGLAGDRYADEAQLWLNDRG